MKYYQLTVIECVVDIELFQGCCKFPVLDSDGKAKKIVEQFKDQKLEAFLLECVSLNLEIFRSFI